MSIAAFFVALPDIFKSKVKPNLPEQKVDNSDMLSIGGWTPYSYEDLGENNKPKPNQQYEVIALYGERVATYRPDGRSFLDWRADDCTHPEQNCNISILVTAWRLPIDKNNITEDADFQVFNESQKLIGGTI